MADGDVNGVTHDLSTLFSSAERNFLVRNNGDQVEISSLSGKNVGIYFSGSWCGPCLRFTPKLVELYQEVASKGDFEVVFVSSDRDEASFKDYFSKMPWLAVPFFDSDSRQSLKRLFNVRGIPNLVVIGSDGKVASKDGTAVVIEHGVEGYPFTRDRLDFLKEREEARERAERESQTLESLFVSGDKDFVIGKDGSKVPVSELVGKNILIYFSAHWCPPCRAFTPELVKTYHEIKGKDEAFEAIFVSSDRDQDSFDKYYSEMPWLALPYGDERKQILSRRFKVRGIPTAIAIGPSGRTVTTEARGLISEHGADAYPFTEEHLKRLKEAKEEPKKPMEGYVCDGDVCRKV